MVGNENKFTYRGPATAASVKNISLPQKIVCKICKKPRDKAMYSQRQLNNLSWKIHQLGKSASSSASAQCRHCTGAQVTELNCCVCLEVKGLDEFSKAQRRDPDKARCIACVRMHEETEPDHQPPDSDSDDSSFGVISNAYASSDGGHSDDANSKADSEDDETPIYSSNLLSVGLNSQTGSARPAITTRGGPKTFVGSASGNTARMSMSGEGGGVALSGAGAGSVAGGSAAPGGIGSRPMASTAGNSSGWVTQPRRPRRPQAVVTREYNAYNPQGIAHRVMKEPTLVSEPHSADTLPEHVRGGGKWAKIKGSKQDIKGKGIFADSDDEKYHPKREERYLDLSDDEEIDEDEERVI